MLSASCLISGPTGPGCGRDKHNYVGRAMIRAVLACARTGLTSGRANEVIISVPKY